MKQLALFPEIPIYESPIFSIEHIQSIIENNDFIAEGTECRVYKLSDNIVFKYYWYASSDEIADIFENAKIAANCGIAPAVYQLFDNGYTTEKVQTLDFDRYYELYCSGQADCEYEILEENGIDINDFIDLCDRAEKLSIGDMHLQNIGINENGQLVCIDFGMASYDFA